MKYIKQNLLAIVVLLFLGLSSCQEESSEIVTPPAEETIAPNSASATLLGRISQKDGSEDNIVDGGSCTTLVLPFKVVVNNIEILIESEDDYDRVEDIIDEFETDEDSIAIQFPVDVTLPDHSVVTVNNIDELEDLLEDCIEDGFDDDIECIDIEYPITFSIYNSTTQQASTIEIKSDSELYTFLESIDEDDIVSLNYPVTLVLASGETITVENNDELEDTIEEFEDSCDEDDDNDHNDDDVDDTELKNTLQLNTWIVTKYDSSGISQTDLLNSFEITFSNDSLLIGTDSSEEYEGEWSTSGSSGFLELELEFDTDGNLKLLNKDWRVDSFSTDQIDIVNQDPEKPISVTLSSN